MAATKSRSNLLLGVLLVTAAAAADNDNDGKLATTYYHRHGHQHRRLPPPAPVSPPPSPPLPPPPSPTNQCQCCNLCPIEPCPEPLPTPAVGRSSPAAAAAVTTTTTNCVAALSGIAPCIEYLTGGAGQIPGPYGLCCRGLAAFLQSGDAGGDGRLGCFCPLLHGDVNRWIARPVLPARLVLLPVACSLQYPPKLIPLCFNQTASTATNNQL